MCIYIYVHVPLSLSLSLSLLELFGLQDQKKAVVRSDTVLAAPPGFVHSTLMQTFMEPFL